MTTWSVCSKCNEWWLSSEGEECPECGGKLKPTCPWCGHETEKEVCPNCGKPT